LAFGRPNVNGPVSGVCEAGPDRVEEAFQLGLLSSPLGGIGNLPRNPCRASIQKRMDFAVSKRFRFTERAALEFRTEFFNLFNFTNFAAPISDLQDGAVGTIENTVGGPRVIQMGLRMNF
jgi:hypothetical protein